MNEIKQQIHLWICLTCLALVGCGERGPQLLNVSYDPTREVFSELNKAFLEEHQKTFDRWTINTSNGGSSSQASSVINGTPADVVTLALWQDVDAIRSHGLINPEWEKRFPNNSVPWYSTIVFVVRKGNPKKIKDWPDLVKDTVKIVTPNPKTSGNGRMSFLAAWGSVLDRGGKESDALEFVTKLYANVPVLDSGARGSTLTFAKKGIGDVHLTWENEAYLEKEESAGELEIVYPASSSIRAEPPVAVVDGNVDRRKTRTAAEAYLQFLFTAPAQRIIAKHHYRPIDEKVQLEFRIQIHPIRLFPVTTIVASWAETQTKFFANDAIFDQIINKRTGK